MARFFSTAGAVFGFLSVALGAFGAHALKERLDAYSMSVYQTGVQYQFYHAFALLIVGILFALRTESGLLKAGGYAFLVGIFLFSGSLYLLAFTGVKAWGAVTPLGGLGFLVGWACVAISVFRW